MGSESAALSRSPLPVNLGGHIVSLPWRPAAVWATSNLAVLAAQLAEPADRDRIAEWLLKEPDVAEAIQQESLRILGQQTGRKWWEGARLLATSTGPEILGHLTLAGVDPWAVSVGQWCAATYALCTKDANERGRLRFDFSLSIPPRGYEDEWDDGADDAGQIAAAVAGMMG